MKNLEKIAIVATAACVVKFMAEGITFYVGGHAINLGHVDAMTYSSLLLPLWGAHGYTTVNKDSPPEK